MDEKVPSAADHEWHEVVVHIYPSQTGARFVALTRKNRGSQRVWQRHLFTVETPALSADEAVTLEGVLRLAGQSLLDASGRAKRH
jgi:hypothetical protein